MKKLVFVALCFVMAITAYASSENKFRYDYESSDTTIVFDECRRETDYCRLHC